MPSASHFFVSIGTGIVLALAFQLLLTALSVASGVTAVNRAVDPVNKQETEIDQPNARVAEPRAGRGDAVQKLNHAVGLWTMVTASLALFFASWLGVELASTASVLAGAILGMVIWSLFFISVTAFETAAFTSVLGSLLKTAAGSMKSGFQGVAGVFSKSPEKKVADAASEITAAVRRELFGETSGHDLRRHIGAAFDKFARSTQIQPETVRKELAALLDDTEVEVVTRDWDRVVASVRSKPGIKPERAKEYASVLKGAFRTAREEAGADKARSDKVADAAGKIAGLPPEEIEATKRKLASYLRSTGKPELSPEAVKADLETLLHDPKAGKAALKERLAHIDKPALAAMIAERRDMRKEDAERLIDRVHGALESFRSSASNAGASGDDATVKERAVRKIQSYVDSLDRPELRYADLENDVRLLFSDPKAGAEALLDRAKSFDRDTIKAIARSRGVPEEDVDDAAARIEEVRDNVASKAEQMKREVQRRVEEAKSKARDAAEESSRVAATAAWWAVGTAVVSGLCAVLGGITAVTTG